MEKGKDVVDLLLTICTMFNFESMMFGVISLNGSRV